MKTKEELLALKNEVEALVFNGRKVTDPRRCQIIYAPARALLVF